MMPRIIQSDNRCLQIGTSGTDGLVVGYDAESVSQGSGVLYVNRLAIHLDATGGIVHLDAWLPTTCWREWQRNITARCVEGMCSVDTAAYSSYPASVIAPIQEVKYDQREESLFVLFSHAEIATLCVHSRSLHIAIDGESRLVGFLFKQLIRTPL